MQKRYETDRLILQTLECEAAPLVLTFYEENKEEFEPWEPQRNDHFYTLAYHRASLAAEHNYMTEGRLIRLWVFQKKHPEEIIGSICFHNILKDPYQSCGLGYKFATKHQHQGYALESLQKALDVMFQEFHLHRVEAHIMPSNTPSLRLIEKLGFHYEGSSYSYAKIKGSWEDHMRYSLLSSLQIKS